MPVASGGHERHGVDIHAVSINTPGYPTMPWVMSKFLAVGLSLEEVVGARRWSRRR